MTNVLIQSRVRADLKQDADALFASMGLTTADAIRLFLQQSLNVGGLPFRPTAKRPNAETIEAMQELAQGRGKKLKSTKDFYGDLGI